MKITNEIKKMSAVELLDTFTVCGEKKIESVGVHQDWEIGMTTLLFEDMAMEICGYTVSVVDYYTPSESVSNVCERATKNQFKLWFVECNDWYSEYVNNCVEWDDEPKTKMEWAEDLAKAELTLWDGDLDYKLNID